MVKYSCDSCGKTFKQKGHFMNHLQRKTPCDNIKDKIEKIVEKKVGEVIEEKIQEIVENNNLNLNNQNSKKYKIAETFVGCGGAHLGFKRNNFETCFVNDIWDESMVTLKNNFELKENQIYECHLKEVNKKLLKSNILIYKKFIRLIRYKKASDYWREKLILNYSKSLFISSLKILFIIISFLLFIYIIDNLFINISQSLFNIFGIVELSIIFFKEVALILCL